MNYILKDRFEPRRLDEQSNMVEFSIARELKSIPLKDAKKILDAGCGSGVLCRYIEKNYPNVIVHGCDISNDSLTHGRKKALSGITQFYFHDLLSGPTTNMYDLIINRLVFHHLSLALQRKMLISFKNSLSIGGRLCVIDLDGLFLNLGTTSESLRTNIDLLNKKFEGNLTSARFLPSLFSEAGFSDVRWEVITMDFQGKSREEEVLQWAQRFESALDFYVDVLGSEFEARSFFRKYMDEASRKDVVLYYNKFVVTGILT